MYDEFIIDDDQASMELVENVAEFLNENAYDNLDEEGKQIGFLVSHSRVIKIKGVWGIIRLERQDIDKLCENFPDTKFTLTRTWDTTSSPKLEDAENYSRVTYQYGKAPKKFKPQIVWVEEKSGPNAFLR